MKLIDKDVLVAEIERLKADALQKKSQCKRSGLERIMHQIGAYNKILSFIDTLEVKEISDEYDGFLGKELKMVDDEIERLEKLKVKEVDLEKEISKYLGDDWEKDAEGKIESEMIAFAKHFFELGLSTSNKIQKGK